MADVKTARDPVAKVAWALETFPRRVALTVSFGGGGLVLAHIISRLDRSVPVLFLDTGFHFPETLAFKAEFAARYRLNVIDLKPLTDPGPLYQTDPDRCCLIRKVEPLERALLGGGYDAWISAVRQDQALSRESIESVERHRIAGRDIVKIFPLAQWTRDDVARYLKEHDVPHHPLQDQGYTSIGCWPCTRATAPGESERAGRWSGTDKKECGLHTFTVKQT